MRKSRFMLNLITATAIGLSVLGCDSSDSGAIRDTTDITAGANSANGQSQQQRQQLREYMLLSQRGLENGNPTYAVGSGQSSPTAVPEGRTVVAEPGDGVVGASVQLYELIGIANTPQPNANILAPGGAGTEPSSPGDLQGGGTTGYHESYPSPNGDYVIAMSRAKDRGFPGDDVGVSQVQVYALNVSPLDVTFPPTITFGAPADPISIFSFAPDQGEFVSGVWSTNGAQFYASISGQLLVFPFDGTIGRLGDGQGDPIQALPFPAGPGTGFNNAVKLISSPDGAYLYALDNANNTVVVYSRNTADGQLTQIAAVPTVSDPRGFTLFRNNTLMYVAGRASEALAGYSLGVDGGLTPFDLFPEVGAGPVPFNLGVPLGDVDANPQTDQIFVSLYSGALQSYNVNPATGALTSPGNAASTLAATSGRARNSANVEVEPTGRFVFVANENDLDTFQSFVTPANGFPFNESAVFANTDSANNGAGQPFLSATPTTDATGRIVYVTPQAENQVFTGNVNVFRIAGDGTTRAENDLEAENPYGIAFFQKVFTPPAAAPDATGGATTP